MNIVEHRPPLKRIDLGARRKIEFVFNTESEGTRALRELGERIENERIWRCVERASQAQGSGE